MGTIKIKTNTIEYISFSAIKCNGMVNATLWFKDNVIGNEYISLYNLSFKQCESLESLDLSLDTEIVIDSRLLEISEETWLDQNGIIGKAG
jgi:hypothetical protein